MLPKRPVGRPKKAAVLQLATPVRGLVTIEVREVLGNVFHDLSESDAMRLALWMLFASEGVFNTFPELQNDPTWDSLKKQGLVGFSEEE